VKNKERQSVAVLSLNIEVLAKLSKKLKPPSNKRGFSAKKLNGSICNTQKNQFLSTMIYLRAKG